MSTSNNNKNNNTNEEENIETQFVTRYHLIHRDLFDYHADTQVFDELTYLQVSFLYSSLKLNNVKYFAEHIREPILMLKNDSNDSDALFVLQKKDRTMRYAQTGYKHNVVPLRITARTLYSVPLSQIENWHLDIVQRNKQIDEDPSLELPTWDNGLKRFDEWLSVYDSDRRQHIIADILLATNESQVLHGYEFVNGDLDVLKDHTIRRNKWEVNFQPKQPCTDIDCVLCWNDSVKESPGLYYVGEKLTDLTVPHQRWELNELKEYMDVMETLALLDYTMPLNDAALKSKLSKSK